MSITCTKWVPLNARSTMLQGSAAILRFASSRIWISASSWIEELGTHFIRGPCHCFTRYLRRFPQVLFSIFFLEKTGKFTRLAFRIFWNSTKKKFRMTPAGFDKLPCGQKIWGMVWRFPQRFLHVSSLGKSLSVSICGIDSSLMYF